MVIVPQADKVEIKDMAERLRKQIEFHSFEIDQQVTASIGIAIYRSNESINTLVSRSDTALYDSKQSGRNRVTCSSDPRHF